MATQYSLASSWIMDMLWLDLMTLAVNDSNFVAIQFSVMYSVNTGHKQLESGMMAVAHPSAYAFPEFVGAMQVDSATLH